MFTRINIFWLLDVVCETREPLAGVYSPGGGDDYYLGMFNRRSHGLDLAQTYALLEHLFEEDLIAVWLTTNGLLRQSDIGMKLSLPEIQQCLTIEGKPYNPESVPQVTYWYGMTDKGGAVWESIAKPNWEKYVRRTEYSVAANDDGRQIFALEDDIPGGIEGERCSGEYSAAVKRVELESLNRELLEDFLRRDQQIYRVVNVDTIVRRHLTDWDAAYWKKFDHGEQISYNLVSESQLSDHGAVVIDYAALDNLLDRWPLPLSKTR